MIEILQENIDHIFIILGANLDQKLFDELQNHIKSSNMEKRIIINDILGHNDFISLLKEVDLVVNSSISEGMSNAIMEAMSIGVPVLARENEGNLKLIKHNHNGLIFSNKKEFKEMFYKIHNDTILRENIIFNSIKEINDKFSFDSEVKNYNGLLHEFREKYYFRLFENNIKLNLIFSRNVHPFSEENNNIFNVFFILNY